MDACTAKPGHPCPALLGLAGHGKASPATTCLHIDKWNKSSCSLEVSQIQRLMAFEELDPP